MMKEIKKIAYIAGYDMSLPTGASINEREFIESLVKKFGKNTCIYTVEPETPLPHLEEADTKTFQKDIFERPWRYTAKTYILARKVAREIDRSGADIIVHRLNDIPYFAYLVSKFSKKPYFIKTAANWWSTEPPRNFKEFILFKIKAFLHLSILKRAHGIDVGLPKLQTKIEEKTRQNVPVIFIPNAGNTDKFKPFKPNPFKQKHESFFQSKFVTGYVGTYPSNRGALHLYKMFLALKDKHPDLNILIAGWDDGMNALKDKIEAQGLQDRFLITGHVPYDQVPEIMASADLLVSFYEAWMMREMGNTSQKMAQYLASGKAVISVPEGQEFLEEQDLGARVAYEDDEGMAEAVEHWMTRLKDQSFKDDLEKRARQYALDHFSIQKMFEKRISFWQNCVEKL